MHRLLLLFALAGCACLADERPVLPPQLTLEQAVSLALRNSTALRTAQARLEQAEARGEQARSALRPQVNISAYQAYQTVNLRALGIDVPFLPGKVGPFAAMDARVLLTQDLLNLAAWQRARTSAERVPVARLQAQNARELVALNVVTAYLAALRTQASRDTLTEQIRLARDLSQITDERFKVGVTSALEVNRASQQINTLEQQRLETEQALVNAKLQLANLLQARVTSEFTLVEPTPALGAEPPDRDAAVRQALAARADYQAAQRALRVAELQVRSNKAARYPVFQARFDDGQSGNTPFANVNTYRLQGVLNVPLVTGGRVRAEIAEAEAALREAQAGLDETRSQVETEVLSAVTGVQLAMQQVRASQANINLSREEIDLARARFTQGVADNTELINAQDRLARADEARIRAAYALGLARANLSRATGSAEQTFRP